METSIETWPTDAGKPIHDQIPSIRTFNRAYVAILPDLSAVCENRLACVLMPVKVEMFGMKATGLGLLDPPDQNQAPVSAPRQTVKVDSSFKIVIPFHTDWWDPRKEPFNGNPEKAARYLGELLGDHIQQSMGKVKQASGKAVRLIRHTAVVYGRIPVGMARHAVNGLKLSASLPMLQAKVAATIVPA